MSDVSFAVVVLDASFRGSADKGIIERGGRSLFVARALAGAGNGTLFERLHDLEGAPLTWEQRMRAAVGIGRGLDFLHSASPHPIVHRDVKTMNILLNAELEACISDFGTLREQRRTLHTNMMNAETHMTTKVVIGTDAYMPPEVCTPSPYARLVSLLACLSVLH